MSGKREKAKRRQEALALARAVESEGQLPHIRDVIDRILVRDGLEKTLARGEVQRP